MDWSSSFKSDFYQNFRNTKTQASSFPESASLQETLTPERRCSSDHSRRWPCRLSWYWCFGEDPGCLLSPPGWTTRKSSFPSSWSAAVSHARFSGRSTRWCPWCWGCGAPRIGDPATSGGPWCLWLSSTWWWGRRTALHNRSSTGFQTQRSLVGGSKRRQTGTLEELR